MKKIITTASAVLMLATSGCMNIVGHVDGDYKPYQSTKGCALSIAEAFVEKPEWHGGSAGEAGMAHAVSILALPFMLLMLPFEAVADTVTFPYDYFNTRRDASRPNCRSEEVAAHISTCNVSTPAPGENRL